MAGCEGCEQMLNYETIVDLLIEMGYLKGKKILDHSKKDNKYDVMEPCEDCNHFGDDCVCEHNELLSRLKELDERTS